ncbi:30S ribosomal protein S8 [Angomonas deanei]|nr:30S ribosomal protein S8 [Angomonas deanei]|eukprot:EPY38788.1 30S ribosomal protein S8 [Angomonas deanei]
MRQGSVFSVAGDVRQDETKLRQQLNILLADERDPFRSAREARQQQEGATEGARYHRNRLLVNLPGVERKRDLPADPITRLFFQHKGDHALYYGSYDHPSLQDSDRVQLERRTPRDWTFNVPTPVYDFCHRLREAGEQRKRFVVVPSTIETRGCAKVMLDHGLVAGFRDFHNDRAFAVELKYFQGLPTINVIEPCSYDGKTEFEWSPKMMRRLMNTHGIHNRLVVYVCRTADNRVIDHIQAVKENIGGRGLINGALISFFVLFYIYIKYL